jgi:hypothetical protein
MGFRDTRQSLFPLQILSNWPGAIRPFRLDVGSPRAPEIRVRSLNLGPDHPVKTLSV